MQCALLANSAGIGGGPFYVPLLTVVLGFDLKAATGLSHTIVGKPATPAARIVSMRIKMLQTVSRGLQQSAARLSLSRPGQGASMSQQVTLCYTITVPASCLKIRIY